MAGRIVPERRGVARNYTMDREAVALLNALAPSRKGLGRYLSSLVKAEMARKEERQKLKEAVLQVFNEVCC